MDNWYFKHLPPKLILDILWRLPIGDVLSLRDVTADALPMLHERIDPSRYLEQDGPFTHADDVLEELSRRDGVMSGSRALEWFLPGSTAPDSDWDFYIPHVESTIVAVKRALELSGVTFETCFARAVRELEANGSVSLNANEMIAIVYEAELRVQSQPQQPQQSQQPQQPQQPQSHPESQPQFQAQSQALSMIQAQAETGSDIDSDTDSDIDSDTDSDTGSNTDPERQSTALSAARSSSVLWSLPLWSREERTILRAMLLENPALDLEGMILPDGSVRWIRDLHPVLIDQAGTVSALAERLADDYDGLVPKVLFGTAAKNGKSVKVQLMICHAGPERLSLAGLSYSPVFRTMFSFYASHVQCFVAKHLALHMYYDLTLQRRAYRWRVPVILEAKAVAGVEKYTARGFRFEMAASGLWTRRSATDSSSYLVELRDGPYSPSSADVKGLQWSQKGDVIKPEATATARTMGLELLRRGIVTRAVEDK
ncbi:hypothetical protein NKR23_g8998 [Pleurostoma richardsiae]|uniref:F-box domain-containing protein n=1 Tax=Pleurostoma richardsiae TaxID=41990 RepID=A0AA38RDT2_9PEZI|nr:hypothetical protein NKR23_g8998 [Pleurostoma richardsiae]